MQNGRRISEVEGTVCADIRKKVIYMAEHLRERFGVRSEAEETFSSQSASSSTPGVGLQGRPPWKVQRGSGMTRFAFLEGLFWLCHKENGLDWISSRGNKAVATYWRGNGTCVTWTRPPILVVGAFGVLG